MRQLCPETLTSAPVGTDSKRSANFGGDDLRKSGMDAEHAETAKPHATTAMTLLIDNPTDIYAASSRDLAPPAPTVAATVKVLVGSVESMVLSNGGFCVF